MKILTLFLSISLIFCFSKIDAQTGGNCSNAVNLSILASPYQGTTVGFTNDFDISCLGSAVDRIFYIDVPSGQVLSIGQTSNNYDSRNRAAYGGDCPGQTEIDCWDDPDYNSILWNNTTGVVQRIWWIQDAFSSSGAGEFTLEWDIFFPPANDECPSAIQFPTIPTNGTCASLEANTALATSSEVGCVGIADDDLWFSFIAPSSTILTELTTISGSNDRVHEVFSGTCGSLTSLLCSDSESNIVTGLIAGETYYIRAYSYYSSAFSEFSLCLSVPPPPPSNDECFDAILVGCGQSINGSTINATIDGVPSCVTSLNTAPGVWYRIIGTGSLISLNLCNSNYDSKIGVFGGGCTALECITGNDDACSLGSYVEFNSSLATIYHILVTGYSSSVGNFELEVDCETTFNNDLVPTALLSPISSCDFPQPQYVQIEITNEGTVPASDFPVGYILNGSTTISTFFATIQPGETATFTFTETVVLDNIGTYDFQIFTDLSSDQNPFNDTLSATVEHLPQPDINVSFWFGDGEVCQGECVYPFTDWVAAYQYEWNTGSTDYFISDCPEQSTDYSVTVTDTAYPGCISVGTIAVEVFDQPEVPVPFASSNTLCPGGTVTITVQNLTENLIWNTGETGSSITVSQWGNYWVTHVDDNGCSSTSQSIFIGFESSPSVSCFGDCVICGQESETLYVNFGDSFQWSTGETSQTISVMPSATTTYSVTVTTPNNCVHVLEKTVTVAPDAQPGSISNLLPPDGAQNVALPVQFSWSPADNATHYDVYIWNENSTEPTFPTTTITQLNLSYFGSLQYGQTYKWKVCARNACSAADEVCSIVQKFTLNFLPDLVVLADNITAPDTAFSGAEFEVAWQVENIGVGSTQGISSSAYWYDACYLSTDDILSGNDIYLGAVTNPNALLSGQEYSNSLTFTLPNGIEGEYNIIVCTDRYGYMPESDEQNNCGVSPVPIVIELSPYPDLIVESILPPAGAPGGIVIAGENYEFRWRVENRDNGLNNSAPTQSGWWYDRVYLSTDSEFNAQAILQKTLRHNGNLDVGTFYDTSAVVHISAYAEDTLYAFVCTDATNREYEYVFETNNCRRSIPLIVPSGGKPDFYLTNISAPDTASNKETISVTWMGMNDGADFGGNLTDQIYLSNQLDFSGWYTFLGSLTQSDSLLNEEAYFAQKNVQIPNNKTGKYYLLLKTNAFGSISESDFTNNTIVDSIVIVSPNLIVSDISPVPDIVSGQTVTFEWEVANIGEGDLLGYYVPDRLRLIDVTEPTNIISIYEGGNITIFSGNTLSRQKTYTPPNGMTGDFCIEVYTNYNESAYENDQYDDNVLFTCDTFHIGAADYPNLIANNIEATSPMATAGDVIEVVFSVENGGDANAAGIWTDRVYLSTDDTWPLASSIFLGNINHSQVAATGSIYQKTITGQLPTYLPQGDYYLYLYTDSGTAVFETNEDDNVIRIDSPISVSIYPLVDLKFDGAPIGPTSLMPGVPASVYYKVENNGTVPTPTDTWADGLYLSPNPTWQPSDLLIAEWQRNGALGAGEVYEKLENFTLPPGFTDAFYLCLVIDHENAVSEVNENNNYVKILQSNGDTISVVYPPKPDLTVAAFDAPGNGIAGQPLTVDFTIKNMDNDGAATGNWTEAVYLSSDLDLSFGDLLLAQINYTDGLAANGGEYSGNMEVTLPLGISGNYFLLIKTDAGNALSEEDENNNVGQEYIFITQPPPGDLFVIKDEIEAPPVDTIATDITISWQVKNIGQNPLSGYMEQGVYLSEDENWNASDILLGTWNGTIGLDPNAAVSHTITARLENVKRGDYHVFVKTDLLDHFLEDDETNNCSNGPTTVFVEVPELPIGLPSTPAVMLPERPIYYRIEIPTDTIGETMRVSLTSNDVDAFNELYLRRNGIPSRTVHDFSFELPFEESQAIIVPALDSGTYYVMAYAVDGLPVQDVELLAEIIPFQITSIDTDEGGNTGEVTSLLEGAKFEAGMTVRLERNGSPTIGATSISLVDASSAFVTFPLNGVETGFYDVIATSGTDTDALANGFHVRTWTIGNDPLLASCSLGSGPQVLTLTNVPASVDVLLFEPNHPASVRPNQTVPITLRFENTGDVDVPVPSRIFSSINGFPLAQATDGLGENLQELPLTFAEENGPENVLRPGGVAIITVYSKATESQGVLKFKLFSN